MMNDESRNASIANCIRDAGVVGKTVFEIGTGAGLTAMLFAKHGARKIVTCESDDQMYYIAQKTIEKNQLSDKIEIFHGTSSQFLNSVQSDFSPEIIFTETLDCGVVGDDKCRHRGGPLHLCYKDSSGKKRCHGMTGLS